MSLLVVTGPPGAGKSTVARRLAADTSPSALVTGDTFYGFLHRGGVDPWLPQAHAQNTALVTASAAACGRMAAAMDVVLDGMVGPWLLDDFAEATGLGGLDYVLLLPSAEVCLERVATRGDHRFTDTDATRRMHREFAGARVDARHVLTDPPGDPGEVATLIRRRRRTGALAITRSAVP